MTLLVLSTSDNNYATRCIVKAAQDRGHKTSVVDPVQLYLFISNVSGYDRLYHSNKGNIGRINLKDYDCIIPRMGEHVDYGAFIVEQLNKNLGIPSIQSATGIRNAKNKLLTLQLCSSAGLATPRTVYLNDARHLEYLIEKVGGYPIIVKLTHGSGGTGVALLKDRISAIPTIQSLLSSRSNILLQEYIESHGKDFRVIVINDKVVASYQRSSVRGDFRANLQQGGSGSPVTLEPADKEFCIKAAKIIDLAVSGIDIIKDKNGKTFLLEANANFGFKVQQITGIDIAKQMVLYAEELVKNRPSVKNDLLINKVETSTIAKGKKDESLNQLIEIQKRKLDFFTGNPYLQDLYRKSKGKTIKYQDRNNKSHQVRINKLEDLFSVMFNTFIIK